MSLHFPELSPENPKRTPACRRCKCFANFNRQQTIARIPRPKVVTDAAGAVAKPADGKGPITSPVTYQVKIGEVSHKVTVQPV